MVIPIIRLTVTHFGRFQAINFNIAMSSMFSASPASMTAINTCCR